MADSSQDVSASKPHSDRDVKGAMEEITYALETLRDCGDRPGMYEDGKIALEHAATVQAELSRLQEQLEAAQKIIQAARELPEMFEINGRTHSFVPLLDVYDSNPASRDDA